MWPDPASGEAVFQQLDRQLQSQSVPLKGEVSEVAVCLRIIQVDQSIEEDTIVCFIIHFTRQILKWWWFKYHTNQYGSLLMQMGKALYKCPKFGT